jgi:hypothetical protein
VSIHESDFADIESDEIDQSDETSNEGKSCNNFEPGLDWHVRVWLVPKDSTRFLDQDFGSSRSQSPMPSLCMNIWQQQIDIFLEIPLNGPKTKQKTVGDLLETENTD